MWKISLSKQTDKFTKNKKIGDDEILSFINKFINYSKGSDEKLKKLSSKDLYDLIQNLMEEDSGVFIILLPRKLD